MLHSLDDYKNCLDGLKPIGELTALFDAVAIAYDELGAYSLAVNPPYEVRLLVITDGGKSTHPPAD
jgi:hypothetical protein